MHASTSKLVAQIAPSAIPKAPRRRVRSAVLSSSLPPSRHLIGPPCPLSNLRPVYYAPLFPELHSSPSRPTTSHPYSLAEFPSSNSSSSRQARLLSIKQHLHSEDLAWRLHQYRVDSFNQSFWTRTNTNFLLAKEEWVERQHAQRHASTMSGLGDEGGVREEDVDLSAFYKEHLERTRGEYRDYNAQLWRNQAGLVWPAVRAALRGWRWRWEVWRAGGER